MPDSVRISLLVLEILKIIEIGVVFPLKLSFVHTGYVSVDSTDINIRTSESEFFKYEFYFEIMIELSK